MLPLRPTASLSGRGSLWGRGRLGALLNPIKPLPGPPPRPKNIRSKRYDAQDQAPREHLRQPLPFHRSSPVRKFAANLPDGTPMQCTWSQRAIRLAIDRNNLPVLRPDFIRQLCQCSHCVDPSSGQRNYAPSQIDITTRFENVEATPEGLRVTIDTPLLAPSRAIARGEEVQMPAVSHEITYTWSHIEALAFGKLPTPSDFENPSVRGLRRLSGVEFWDRAILEKQIRHIDYDEYMKDDQAKWDAMIQILRLGIVFLKNVPRDTDSVERITERMANIFETFYGRTFDVRAKPEAENVAYTNKYLGLHQDLLYLTSPPYLQILHCMDNSTQGGESLFCDGDRIGNLLYPHSKEGIVARLGSVKSRYHYNKNGHRYGMYRTVLDSVTGNFNTVWWSPPFLASQYKPWVTYGKSRTGDNIATRLFEDLINDEGAVFEHKMQPGECVIFDNWRVLHGRNQFAIEDSGNSTTSTIDADGPPVAPRWLRGAYVHKDDFASRASQIPLAVLDAARGDAPRAGMKDWDKILAQKLADTPWAEEVREKVEEAERIDRATE